MALELQTTFTVGVVRVANLEVLKKELEKELEHFRQLPITRDNISELRNARARLNKASEAFNKRRLELQRSYNEPFLVFKQEVDGIMNQIQNVLTPLDNEIKAFEDKDKFDKKEKIVKYYTDKYRFPIVPLDKIFDEKWLNYGVSMERIQTEIIEKITQIETSLTLMDRMGETRPDFAKELKTEYLLSLDFNVALAEVNKRREIASKLDLSDKNATTDDINVIFKVMGSKEMLMKLSKFLKENDYKYERLQ
jgi:hypothetical protein